MSKSARCLDSNTFRRFSEKFSESIGEVQFFFASPERFRDAVVSCVSFFLFFVAHAVRGKDSPCLRISAVSFRRSLLCSSPAPSRDAGATPPGGPMAPRWLSGETPTRRRPRRPRRKGGLRTSSPASASRSRKRWKTPHGRRRPMKRGSGRVG